MNKLQEFTEFIKYLPFSEKLTSRLIDFGYQINLDAFDRGKQEEKRLTTPKPYERNDKTLIFDMTQAHEIASALKDHGEEWKRKADINESLTAMEKSEWHEVGDRYIALGNMFLTDQEQIRLSLGGSDSPHRKSKITAHIPK